MELGIDGRGAAVGGASKGLGLATAQAWILGTMLIGFTVYQLKRLSQVEFRTADKKT